MSPDALEISPVQKFDGFLKRSKEEGKKKSQKSELKGKLDRLVGPSNGINFKCHCYDDRQNAMLNHQNKKDGSKRIQIYSNSLEGFQNVHQTDQSRIVCRNREFGPLGQCVLYFNRLFTRRCQVPPSKKYMRINKAELPMREKQAVQFELEIQGLLILSHDAHDLMHSQSIDFSLIVRLINSKIPHNFPIKNIQQKLTIESAIIL